jgi:class 3 adenylate cyclase
METSFSTYSFTDSLARMDEILAAGDASELTESDGIPSRDRLTYTNGFYTYCSALFVDMRGSSQLAEKHRQPTLARLYRAYISEMTAILRYGVRVRELNIHGDAVWAVYDTTAKTQIDDIFSVAAQAHSLSMILSYKLQKAGFSPIKVGIGLSYGRVLMIKAGYNGSGINDVVWMGDVVNEASHQANFGNKTWNDEPLMVSSTFQQNLNEHNQSLLRWNTTRGCYHGNVVNTAMDEWLQAQLRG